MWNFKPDPNPAPICMCFCWELLWFCFAKQIPCLPGYQGQSRMLKKVLSEGWPIIWDPHRIFIWADRFLFQLFLSSQSGLSLLILPQFRQEDHTWKEMHFMVCIDIQQKMEVSSSSQWELLTGTPQNMIRNSLRERGSLAGWLSPKRGSLMNSKLKWNVRNGWNASTVPVMSMWFLQKVRKNKTSRFLLAGGLHLDLPNILCCLGAQLWLWWSQSQLRVWIMTFGHRWRDCVLHNNPNSFQASDEVALAFFFWHRPRKKLPKATAALSEITGCEALSYFDKKTNSWTPKTPSQVL